MHRVCVIPGDGIGPEVMDACLKVLENLTDNLKFVHAEIGVNAYKKYGKYLPEETVQLLQHTDACLFGALTTPSSPDYRSPLLAIRQGLKLYANVRPVRTLLPGRPEIDMVIIRENTEDLYVGLEEYHGSYAVAAKIVTREASERIVNFALDYARKHGRKKIACVHKSNVLRKTDGLFAEIFREKVADEEVETEEVYVDTCALRLVTSPERFDVILTLNLYGDILSDLAAGLVGGLGFAPSANIGESYAMFEPVHGSAPDIAGKDAANPTAMILSAAMMLDYLKMEEEAARIRKAIAAVYASGVKTRDIGGETGTKKFADLIVKEIEKGS
ncbi:MAG: isocitrate/isopropylmalate dehydrogenase family protein [Thermoplasmata archaeon]|nr:isocitrate/isopropylmalate dehydrogenase family protein [Thermoplasmata archaeon]